MSSYCCYDIAIGLYRDGPQWKWNDGSLFEYSHWLPDTGCDGAVYAALTTTYDSSAYPSMYWSCNGATNSFYYFICQKPAQSSGRPTEPTLLTPPAQEGACPTGWTYGPWSQKCYYVRMEHMHDNGCGDVSSTQFRIRMT